VFSSTAHSAFRIIRSGAGAATTSIASAAVLLVLVLLLRLVSPLPLTLLLLLNYHCNNAEHCCLNRLEQQEEKSSSGSTLIREAFQLLLMLAKASPFPFATILVSTMLSATRS
jgi:hypothetical protein